MASGKISTVDIWLLGSSPLHHTTLQWSMMLTLQWTKYFRCYKQKYHLFQYIRLTTCIQLMTVAFSHFFHPLQSASLFVHVVARLSNGEQQLQKKLRLEKL